MKTIVLLIFSLSICFTAVGQAANDEQQLKDIMQKLENQWNKDDFSFFTDETYMPDAILVSPVGDVWKGQAEMKTVIDNLGDSMFKYSTSKYTVKDISFLSPAVALMVVHAADVIEQDFVFPDGSERRTKGDKSESILLHTFVKQNGNWRIASTQVTWIRTDNADAKTAAKGD